MGTLVAVGAGPEISTLLRRSTSVSPNGSFEELVGPEELIVRLERGEQIDAVVLGPGLEEPVRIAQRVHSVDRDVAVLVLTHPGRHQQITQAVQFAPLLGEDVGCWSVAEPHAVVGEAKEALVRVRKRRSYRATIAAASADVAALSSPRPRVEQYLDRLLDHVPIGVVAVNERGLILAWNRRAGDLLDRSEREALGTSLMHVFPEGEREKLDRSIADCLISGEQCTPEILRRETAEGRLQFVEITAAPLTERTGESVAMVLIQDVTERKQAEEALKASEERYRAVIEQTGEGIYLFDAKTKRILETNLAFQSMLGYTRQELLRMSVYDLVPNDPASVDRNVGRTLDQGHLLVGERSYRRKDGSLGHLEVSGSVISYGSKQAVCAVARDITERKRSEEAAREIKEAERNRMARDLHDGVLQDLTYAAAAMEITKLKMEDATLKEELEEEITDIRRAVGDLREAVYDLRLGDERTRPLSRLVESLIEQNRQRMPGCEVQLLIGEGVPSMPVGQTGTDLLRILQETLTNARRHSGARRVQVSLRVEGAILMAEVSDDGCGFSSEASPGIGLRSMRERADSLDGELEVESEPGGGARVRLRVPLSGLLRREQGAP